MELKPFVRKPFLVEAIEITEENIAEIAEHVGTLKFKEDGSPFIHVNTKKVPNVYRVYPGFWMTKMGNNVRCYTKKIFTEHFVETTPEINTWVQYISTVQQQQQEETFTTASLTEVSE